MKEAKSVMVFLSLAIVSFVLFKAVDFYNSQKESKIYIEEFAPLMPDFVQNSREFNPKEKAVKPKSVKFTFNPNLATKEDFIQLGIPAYVANNIINYRNKGGKFRYRNDFQKIYNLDPSLFAELYSFIDLPEKKEDYDEQRIQVAYENEKPERPEPRKTISPFDLNRVDTIQLKSLRGIGSVLANRIVKYRQSLGGFYSLQQLNEVYGLNEEAIAELSKYGKIDTDPNKIKINEVKFLKHPYLTSNQAKAIINYRNQHGSFQNIKDLEAIKILDVETLGKIEPYLSF